MISSGVWDRGRLARIGGGEYSRDAERSGHEGGTPAVPRAAAFTWPSLELCCGFVLPVSCETRPALRSARADCSREWQSKTERH